MKKNKDSTILKKFPHRVTMTYPRTFEGLTEPQWLDDRF